MKDQLCFRLDKAAKLCLTCKIGHLVLVKFIMEQTEFDLKAKNNSQETNLLLD